MLWKKIKQDKRGRVCDRVVFCTIEGIREGITCKVCLNRETGSLMCEFYTRLFEKNGMSELLKLICRIQERVMRTEWLEESQ